MTRKIKVVYEGGFLKPLEPLDNIREHQVLDIAFEVDPVNSGASATQRRTIRLGGVLKDHPLGDDIPSDLEEMRARTWTHVSSELTDG